MAEAWISSRAVVDRRRGRRGRGARSMEATMAEAEVEGHRAQPGEKHVLLLLGDRPRLDGLVEDSLGGAVDRRLDGGVADLLLGRELAERLARAQLALQVARAQLQGAGDRIDLGRAQVAQYAGVAEAGPVELGAESESEALPVLDPGLERVALGLGDTSVLDHLVDRGQLG